MKLIKPSYEILPLGDGSLNSVYNSIEIAGRICYKSESKGDSKKFVNKLIELNHFSPLEHGTVYMDIANDENLEIKERMYFRNPYSRVYSLKPGWQSLHVYITINYRTLIEHNWLDDLKYICKPTEYHDKRISVKLICSRAIANELVRHRKFSFCQESTRQMAA